MTLPASGQITWAQIQTEFGGSNPINANEYYRGGGLVPNATVNANIPTSGQIAASNFYSTTKTPVQITDQLIDQLGSGTAARAGYRLNLSGIAEARRNLSYSTIETWLQAGSAGNYQAMATVSSATGSGTNTGTFGSWLALSSSQEWSCIASISSTYTLTLSVQIRDASTLVVLDTATVTLYSERA